MSIEDEIAQALIDVALENNWFDVVIAEDIAAAVMPLVKRAQAEARAQELRDFAADLDRYVGTILNAESAAGIARVKANGIESEGTGAP